MAGLLTPNQGAAPADTGEPQQAAGTPQGAGELQDPILQQIEQGVEQSVPDQYKQGYQQIVNAGMALMFSRQTSDLIEQQLDAGGDLAANIADGISKLMVILYNESQGKMEIPAVGLAAVTLMAIALDYAEKTRGTQITPEIVNEATKQTTAKTLEKFGISQDQVNQVIAAGQQGGAAQGGAQPQAMGA